MKRETRGEIAPDTASRPMLVLEMGHPGVFSPRVLFPVSRRQAAGGGFILLPGLKGLLGEYRFHIIPPRRERFALHAGGGLVIYDIDSDNRSAFTAGIHVSLGTTYQTRSRFLLGGSLGFLNNTGRETEDPVESFGIHKGLSTGYVNFNVAYLF